jgi:hypothetical protein
MDIPSFNNVPMTRIEQEYHRVRARPVSLLEVAQLFGWDYFELCMWIREKAIPAGFKLHVRTAKEAKLLQIDNSPYLLDYYLCTGYSYAIIAIIFNYGGEQNVHRSISKSQVYIDHIKGKAPRKKTCRPKMIEYKLQKCKAVSLNNYSTHRLNRLVYRAVDSKIPVRRDWHMDIAKAGTVYFFEPIYEIVYLHCKSNNYNMDKFINMALIQEKVPGSSDDWIDRPSAIAKNKPVKISPII